MSVMVWKLVCRSGSNGQSDADLVAISLDQAPGSLDAVSAQIPGGAYTTFRTYQHNRALRLEDHFQRLEQTAQLAGQPLVLDRPCLRAALQRLTRWISTNKDQRFRITVDLEQDLGQVYLAAEPLHVPSAADYQKGVRAITCDLQRRLPEAKLTRFIERAGEVRRTLPPGINEAIMVDPNGLLREGLSSNFFAVRSSILYTAADGVLAGITRATVLDCAARLGIPVRLEAVSLTELSMQAEAFITSASRGVLPLRRIDDVHLPRPMPGTLTRQIIQAFDQALADETEPI